MLPTDWNGSPWPDVGEIDIMESVGFDPGWIHGSIHTHSYNWVQHTQKTSQIKIPDVDGSFHVYAIEWYPDHIDFFVDSNRYFSFKNEGSGWKTWPFDKDFHFILNLAIGGFWGGEKGVDDSSLPQKLVVDYVRAYRQATN